MASKLLTKGVQAILLTLDQHGTASTVSTFQKTGKLTPDEFVQAGDFLVENFPSWSWGSGLPEKTRSHLPADKQFLITRDVPCYSRTDTQSTFLETLVEGEDDGDDGWVETTIQEEGSAAGAAGAAESAAGGAAAAAAVDDVTDGVDAVTLEADEEVDDLDDFDDVAELDDFDYDGDAVEDDDDAALAAGTDTVTTRTYDITITFDVHYSTPRVWLFGYDASHQPLKKHDWQEDFSKDHVDKTVTYEQHPHNGYSCPSIHPCRHAQAMLKMMSLVVGSSGGQLDVKYYLLIFLKFIQAIIPNIEYDYTGEFVIGSK